MAPQRAGTTLGLLRATLRLDRAQLQVQDGLRGALGVALPLLVGIAVDRPLDGAIAAGGAFSAGFAVLTSGYRTRVSGALLSAAGLALSTFVGAAVADRLWLLALVLAGWGFAAGMLVSLGVAATIIGVQAVVGLLLITPYPMPVLDAGGRAGLVFAGGVGQALLVVTLWPLRRSPVERRALSTVYASLARYAAGILDGQPAPPDPRPLALARASLADPQPFSRGDALMAFSALHAGAERLRNALAGLAHLRPLLAGVVSRATAVAALDVVTAEAAVLLGQVSTAIALPGAQARRDALAAVAPGAAPERWERLLAAHATIQAEAATAGPALGHVGPSLVSELAALSEELLAALGAVALLSGGPVAVTSRAASSARATLRAHLTLRSVAFRHALRLGVVLAVGVSLASLLPFEHRYWLPLTALVVLKPDFTSTFIRGLGRIAGTVVGAAAATGLVVGLQPGPLLLTLLLALTVWAGYAVFFANYAVYGLCVTGFVVFLLSFTGLPTAGTVGDRIEATVLGGLLALLAYLVWPTWERVRLPEQLARLLDAQERFVGGLLDAYRQPGPPLEDLRAAARLARVTAEASVERAAGEPSRRGLSGAAAADVVTRCRSVALAALALQTHLRQALPATAGPELAAMTQVLRATFTELAAALREERPPLPPAGLRDRQRALRDAWAGPAAGLDAALLDVEIEHLLAALEHLTGTLSAPGSRAGRPAGVRRPAAPLR